MYKRIATLIAAIVLFAVPASARLPGGSLLDGVKPGGDGMIDVLTVFAHQDDETIYGGGAVLLMKKDPRVRLHIMCLTLGQLSEAKDRLGITPEHLARIRVHELQTAAAVYGAEEVIQLDYSDQGLKTADREKLIGQILETINRVGAEIVITHDPLGFTGHPDHIVCSSVATEAFNRSSAERLYYPTLPAYLYRAVKKFRIGGTDIEPARPTMKIDISSVKKLKRMAFYAHASQKHFSGVNIPGGAMMALDHEYYTLAASRE